MLLHIPSVLTPEELAECRRCLADAQWVDGATTSGAQATRVKHNHQLSPGSPLAERLGAIISSALSRHPLFMAAALPKQMLPPLFNRYQDGGNYGNHVDAAIQGDARNTMKVRSDVSTTVFLCHPEEYEGGELIVEDTYGSHEVKLPAGDAIVYPSTSLHRVEPVTGGARIASFLWTQSMVREDWKRAMLFDLDMTILKLRQFVGDSEEVVSLTSHYHNLLRLWAET
ncbi:Fe2+-dependent dioxygenase [Denitratisoma sp. agr-D3]